jgi:gamma-glutamyltranspeptidase/glutathione hydrolase
MIAFALWSATMNRIFATVLLASITYPASGCQSLSAAQATQPAAEGTASATRFQKGAVAADHPVASEAGLEMLKRGGNAVDAAVATSFCLGVVRPYACGIGGGGFMLIYVPARDNAPAKAIALNYRETAPAAITPDYYSKLPDRAASRYGGHAVAVPGTVAGLAHALERYGTLDMKTVLAPAIRAAEYGFKADADFVQAVKYLGEMLDKRPDLKPYMLQIWDGVCAKGEVKAGDIVTYPQLAYTYRVLGELGATAFYKGAIARSIVPSARMGGGVLTAEDLVNYKVSESQPLESEFELAGPGRIAERFRILSMPPPSSGGVAMHQILGMMQRRQNDLRKQSHNSPAYVHMLAELIKHAFADRSTWLADPAFVDVPTAKLLDGQYLAGLAASVANNTLDPNKYGSRPPAAQTMPQDSGTSHFCVIDSTGMAVACTETINLTFGSLIAVPGFGFVLNNEMDDFTTASALPNAFRLIQSDRNVPQPGKRPVSSMSPTIVLKDGKVALIAGASGGPRIITATTQSIVNSLWFGMGPQQAVSSPRFHHQWKPDHLELEQPLMTDAIQSDLRGRGHEIRSMADRAFVQMIEVKPDGIRAVCDPRCGGAPAGW